MSRLNLTHADVAERALQTAATIRTLLTVKGTHPPFVCYPVPRGGVPAAYALREFLDIEFTEDAAMADFILDDLIDSSRTKARFAAKYPAIPFFALLNKQAENLLGTWITFPWERNLSGTSETIEENIIRLLQVIGEDPGREGLVETPERVAKAWKTWTCGYSQKVSDVLKTFEDGGENYDQLLVQKDVPFYSHCEHHLAPIFGTATIAYIPRKRIVGLSKLSRVLDIYARRLQVQERLTSQVADALTKHLDPAGVGVVIRARHLCMESRGICKQGHVTITSALRGVLLTKPEARAEFMAIATRG